MWPQLRGLRCLLPSFLRSSSRSSNASPTSNIAALDGVRGIACLIVFNEHISYSITQYFVHGFELDGSFFPSQLPFIRLFLSGISMVNIFYVLSGYVLSIKILRLMMTGNDHDSARFSILKACLKRAPRLYIPTLTAWFSIALASQLGLYDAARVNYDAKDNTHVTTWGLSEPPPRKYPSLWLQIRDATMHAKTLFANLFIWNPDYPTGDYDKHAWTIVLEMRTSMILFAALWVSSGLPSRHRAVAFAVLLLCAVWVQRYEVACFFAGALLAMGDVVSVGNREQLPLGCECNWDVEFGSNTTPVAPITKAASPTSMTNTTTQTARWHSVLLVLALYLLATPIRSMHVDTFYGWLYALHPEDGRDEGALPRLIGSILLVYLTIHYPFTTSLFTTRFAQYMGRISFAFYLIHGPVIRCLQEGLAPFIWGVVGVYGGVNAFGTTVGPQGMWVKTGKVDCWNGFGAWLVSVEVCLPCAIWLADLFERGVDRPVVRWIREWERWGESWWAGDERSWWLL